MTVLLGKGKWCCDVMVLCRNGVMLFDVMSGDIIYGAPFPQNY